MFFQRVSIVNDFDLAAAAHHPPDSQFHCICDFLEFIVAKRAGFQRFISEVTAARAAVAWGSETFLDNQSLHPAFVHSAQGVVQPDDAATALSGIGNQCVDEMNFAASLGSLTDLKGSIKYVLFISGHADREGPHD